LQYAPCLHIGANTKEDKAYLEVYYFILLERKNICYNLCTVQNNRKTFHYTLL